jgi:hypothetical protein
MFVAVTISTSSDARRRTPASIHLSMFVVGFAEAMSVRHSGDSGDPGGSANGAHFRH